MSGKIGSRWWGNTCKGVEITEVDRGSPRGWLWSDTVASDYKRGGRERLTEKLSLQLFGVLELHRVEC